MGIWWPEIWPHEFLISPIEMSANWPGSQLFGTRPVYTDFNGANRYSCGHISGPHEPIPTKFGLWMFFIILHWYLVSKTLKCKKNVFCDVIASVLYWQMSTSKFSASALVWSVSQARSKYAFHSIIHRQQKKTKHFVQITYKQYTLLVLKC